MLFTTTIIVAVASLATAVPSPRTKPEFRIGEQCAIEWDADTTGKWKQMNIQLMTGHDLNMTPVTTVAQNIDATDPTKNTFSYPCPAVTPTSKIYFYQFSSPADPTGTTWTSRFTIAGPNGETTPPTEKRIGDNGQEILWGNGTLVNSLKAAVASAPQGTTQTTGNSSPTIGGGAAGAAPATTTTTTTTTGSSVVPSPSMTRVTTSTPLPSVASSINAPTVPTAVSTNNAFPSAVPGVIVAVGVVLSAASIL